MNDTKVYLSKNAAIRAALQMKLVEMNGNHSFVNMQPEAVVTRIGHSEWIAFTSAQYHCARKGYYKNKGFKLHYPQVVE